MTDKTCPPFGGGSVDFAKVHEAALAGDDLEKAIAAATTLPGAAKPATPSPAPSTEDAAAPATKPAKGDK